jgi:hypothetical protein
VSFAGQRLQIRADPHRRSYAHARVQVHERLDGSLAVYHAGRCLRTIPAPAEAPLVRARTGPRVTAPQRPPPHPSRVLIIPGVNPCSHPNGHHQAAGRERQSLEIQIRHHIQMDKITEHLRGQNHWTLTLNHFST